MYVTYDGLFNYSLVIIGIVSICVTVCIAILKHKK